MRSDRGPSQQVSIQTWQANNISCMRKPDGASSTVAIGIVFAPQTGRLVWVARKSTPHKPCPSKKRPPAASTGANTRAGAEVTRSGTSWYHLSRGGRDLISGQKFAWDLPLSLYLAGHTLAANHQIGRGAASWSWDSNKIDLAMLLQGALGKVSHATALKF